MALFHFDCPPVQLAAPVQFAVMGQLVDWTVDVEVFDIELDNMVLKQPFVAQEQLVTQKTRQFYCLMEQQFLDFLVFGAKNIF